MGEFDPLLTDVKYYHADGVKGGIERVDEVVKILLTTTEDASVLRWRSSTSYNLVPSSVTYILPTFDYCHVVWSGCTNDAAKHLETLLNFACQLVLPKPYVYSATASCKELSLTTLSARRKLHTCVIMFKCLHSLAPPYLLENSSKRNKTDRRPPYIPQTMHGFTFPLT